jgi:glycosyltransferase involved in cell wall biosynthesis
MFSNSYNLNADSTYVFNKRLINAILKFRKDWIFLYLFPSNIGWKYKNDGFFEEHKENVLRIPFYISVNKKEMVTHFNVDDWQRINQKYAYDVFINNTPEITSQFIPLFQAVTPEGTPFVVNQHHYVIHNDLPYAMTDFGDRGIIMLQIAGSMSAHMNIFNSLNCKRMLDDNFRRHFSSTPKYKGDVIYYGFRTEDYDKHIKESNSEPTFVYNHRLQTYKNWQDTFEVFDKLYSDKIPFKVIVSSIDKNNETLSKPYVIYPTSILDHDQYLDFIAPAHINMINSQHETFCQSIAESMLLGHAVIAPNKATFPELLPANYPYIFTEKKTQYLMARELILDLQKTKQIGLTLKKHVSEKFSEDVFAQNWIKLIERNVDSLEVVKHKLKKKDKAEEYFKKIPDKIPALLLFKNMRTWIGGDQAFPFKKLKSIINAYGFKDKLIGDNLYFVRETI